MRLLAIGAHPDDVEMLCGGTLSKFASAGHHVTVAVATNGNAGSQDVPRHEIAEIRREESEQACSIIGADLIWMDFEDEWLFNDRATRERFIDAYREAKPDLVIAHSEHDYHPDHRVAGQVAADARIPSAVRLVETTLPALGAIPRLYTMDTVGQLVDGLDIHIDISEVIEVKRQILGAHKSQREWLQHIFGMSYIAFMEEQAARRGAEIGVAYAEAFREVPIYPRPPDDVAFLGCLET